MVGAALLGLGACSGSGGNNAPPGPCLQMEVGPCGALPGSRRVRFPPGQAALTAPSHAGLDDIARAFVHQPRLTVEVFPSGHPSENPMRNGLAPRQLIWQRGMAVRQALVARGVPPQRIRISPELPQPPQSGGPDAYVHIGCGEW